MQIRSIIIINIGKEVREMIDIMQLFYTATIYFHDLLDFCMILEQFNQIYKKTYHFFVSSRSLLPEIITLAHIIALLIAFFQFRELSLDTVFRVIEMIAW